MRPVTFGLWIASVAWTVFVVFTQIPGPAY
jgi:hypothetical protein